MSDLVSIIIANYNYADFLAETIRSAQAQTYPNIEILFIDDGSTDNSPDVASQFDITILAQENQGVCAARNNALSFAKGKYVIFLDADDILMPMAVEKLYNLMCGSKADIGYIYGQMEYFDRKTGLFPSRQFCSKALAKGNYISVTCLFEKSKLIEKGGFDRGLVVREDWELFIRLWHHGIKGRLLSEPILKCRKHKDGQNRAISKSKHLVQVKLFYKYPKFFFRKFLTKPWRYIYYLTVCSIGQDLGLYGPTSTSIQVLKKKA